MTSKSFLLIIYLVCASCNFGPKHKLPEINYPNDWHNLTEHVTNQELLNHWSKLFKDDAINKLVELAYHNNLDVKIAISNIEQSRALYGIDKAKILPTILYESSIAKRDNDLSLTDKDYSNEIGLSYELDLWGAIRKQTKASKYRFLSDTEIKRAVMLSVTSEVAQNYILLRSYQHSLKIMQENIDLIDQIVALTKVQKRAGIATEFDLMRILAQKNVLEAKVPNIEANINAAMQSLAVLVGKEPGYLNALLSHAKALPDITGAIPVYLPSQVLRQRPDIKAAEYLLAAETEEIGVAIADFFPSFSLTGSAGYASTGFSNLFGSGSGNWNYGATAKLPLFPPGNLIANYRKSKADAEIAMLTYQKTVLTAFAEVESNLIKYAKELATKQTLQLALKHSAKAAALADARYKAGYDDFLAVIDAKRSLISIKDSLAASETQALLNLIALLKSLGGDVNIAKSEN